MKNKFFALVSIFAQTAQFLMAVPAFARETSLRDAPMVNALRMENKDTTTAVRIHGILLCSMGTENTGQTCELKIRENGTDRVYGISASNNGKNELMRLFQAGTRQVAVEGRLAGEAIEISKAQAL